MGVASENYQAQQEFLDKIQIENSLSGKMPLAYVETYGCAQNENDSERIRGMLSDMGYGFCESVKDADVVIYNTCAVRENAELKVFGNLGALKHLKEKRPDMLIGVCGCMMQQEHISERIRQKYKHVDMIFGTHALYKFPEIMNEARQGKRAISTENSDGRIVEGISTKRETAPLAKVSVMFGCNNFCSYCVVPYVRGRERSRRPEDILAEIQEVAKAGYKEVMLLGQNVNSYGKNLKDEGLTFADLLRKVCEVEGIERVRFMTSHPKDISDELIDVLASEGKICKQLHLPVQSGSSKVLKDMNRKYTREDYLDIVQKVRTKIPDVVLTTDIIVGFPTETNEDFEETLSLLEEVRYDMIFSFIYSKRKGTPAAEMEICLTAEEIHKNFDRMIEVQNQISFEKNQKYLGTVETVLVESISKTNSEFLSGRTDGGKIVNFKGDECLIGKMIDVRIIEAKTWSLVGEVLDK